MLERQTGSLARITLWMFGRSKFDCFASGGRSGHRTYPTRRSVPAGSGAVRLTKLSGRGALVCSAFCFAAFGTTCSPAGSNGATPTLEGVMAKERELKDLFLDTLKDIYFAEKKILSALPKMARAAQSPKLKAAFEKHLAETDGQVERLEQGIASIDETPKGKTCDAIMGIIEEGKEIMDEYKGMPALDAGLLAAAQAVEHYEISRYGTLKTWANELGYKDAVKLLDATLKEERNTDSTLSQLAVSEVNQHAETAQAA